MLEGVPTDGWKLTLDHWVDACKALMESMAVNGYSPCHPIPLDKNGELLNGTHRLACALALHIDGVYVWRLDDKEVWAPAWDNEWFHAHGVPDPDIERAVQDFEAICARRQQEPNEG
jgi:hypothetical protein